MKRQVLKIENGYMFSVIHDDEAVRDEAYRLYYHTERRNRYGYYTMRKYLVTKEPSLPSCMVWILDIMRNASILDETIGNKLHKA